MGRIIGVMLALTVAFSSLYGSNFLSRASEWGCSHKRIYEVGEAVRSDETDSEGHKWTGYSYSGKVLNGVKYRVRYDFTPKDKLFEISYFSENKFESEDERAAAYDVLCKSITDCYGKADNDYNYGYFASSEWTSDYGEIIALYFEGGMIQIFFTENDFDWDTL